MYALKLLQNGPKINENNNACALNKLLHAGPNKNLALIKLLHV